MDRAFHGAQVRDPDGAKVCARVSHRILSRTKGM
jgi:hypothetical protein